MEDSQSDPEEDMPFEHKISQAFGTTAGQSLFRHQTFGQESKKPILLKTERNIRVFAERRGSAFPHHRLVILSLGLLNVVLLIAALVIGIYCAKAKDLEIPHSEVTPLIIERNYLRNHSNIIRAKLEVQAALAQERTNHVQLKLQLKQKKALTDVLEKNIASLRTEKTIMESTKTRLEESCARCPAGWILLKSTCYYFSHYESASRKNWSDSRADCVRQGGDLLVINNLMEQQLISFNFPKGGDSNVWFLNGLWIGLTNVATDGGWVWINNGTEVSTMYWMNGYPIQQGPQSRDCAAFYYSDNPGNTLFNVNCWDYQLNWICEMEPRET